MHVEIEHEDGSTERRNLTPYEQEVFEQAEAALALPLSARLAWFEVVAKAMHSVNRQLGWNGKTIN